jgi:Lipocalin-like domain
MKRVGKPTLGILGLLFLGVVLAAGDAFAQTATYGPNPKGILMVDANGRYVITFARADLHKVASNNRTTATPEENKAIVGGSLTHFGTVSVNAADKTFTFKIETATFPNWSGTEQKRPFTISGDQLQYTAAAASGGGSATVVWKRAK